MVAELVFKPTDRHVGEFADGIVDDLIPPFFDFGEGHAEHVTGDKFREIGVEVKVDEPADVSDKADGADDLKPTVVMFDWMLPRLAV